MIMCTGKLNNIRWETASSPLRDDDTIRWFKCGILLIADDDTRVTLDLIDGDPNSHYINASFIKVCKFCDQKWSCRHVEAALLFGEAKAILQQLNIWTTMRITEACRITYLLLCSNRKSDHSVFLYLFWSYMHNIEICCMKVIFHTEIYILHQILVFHIMRHFLVVL
jgi:hypothetical protein